MSSLTDAYALIKKPVITEKTTDLASAENTYTFRVPKDARKLEIRRAIEEVFSVKVTRVNTMNVRSEPRRRGYSIGKSQAWKKAMVTLADGNTIDIL